jgi:hypothetical protein
MKPKKEIQTHLNEEFSCLIQAILGTPFFSQVSFLFLFALQAEN